MTVQLMKLWMLCACTQSKCPVPRQPGGRNMVVSRRVVLWGKLRGRRKRWKWEVEWELGTEEEDKEEEDKEEEDKEEEDIEEEDKEEEKNSDQCQSRDSLIRLDLSCDFNVSR